MKSLIRLATSQLGLIFLGIAASASGLENPALLREMAAAHALPDLRWPDFSDYAVPVNAFYEPSGFTLAWTVAVLPTPQTVALIESFRQAGAKGLDPEDYDGPRWAGRVAQLQQGHPDVVRFDLAMTVTAMRYVSDLHMGRWNPGLYHSGFDIEQERYHLAELVRERLTYAADVPGVLASVEPPFPSYLRTEKALSMYLAIAAQDDSEQLPATNKPVEPGQPYPGLARLTRLLRLTGDLQEDFPVSPDAYSGPLVNAVKHFQIRHGLNPDGRIGKQTQVQLNMPLSVRVRQLQLTLERFRWVPHDFPRPPIIVNIPEFELRALDESYRTRLEMKVVVGQAYHHQTPVFSADLKSVTFRPYWNVPYIITRAEMLPKLARDPDYFVRNDLEVVNGNAEVVARGAIDDELRDRLRAGTLRVRQTPGPGNSLGLVAFMFPNEYDVYLHGTPATELFAQSRRDFSHGCMRVEHLEKLAEWVLRDQPEWTPERITQAMNGATTLKVDLDRPIPVLIVYATAVVIETGEVHFFDDIYGLDRALTDLAAKGYPCPRWVPTNGEPGRRPRE